MLDKNKDNKNLFDIFIANSVFPDAESLFVTHLKPLEDIKSTAIVILDTNALLVAYSIGKESLSQSCVMATYAH